MGKVEIPQYTVEDFKNLLYPVFEVPKGKTIISYLGDNVLDYPEFKVVLGPHGFKAGDKDRVIRWIAASYDMGSPFIQDYPDVNQRMVMAALYVGFEIDDMRRFEIHVEKMMLGECEPVVDMIIRYCRNYNSPDYSFLVAIWQDYFRTLKQIQMGEDYNFDTIKKMREEIKSLSREFLSGNNSENIRDKLYKEIEKDSLLLRPEDVADRVESGQGITDTEVKDYNSNRIKIIGD